jgi:hypothetical protein
MTSSLTMESCFDFWQEQKIFSPFRNVHTGSGGLPSILFNGCRRAISTAVKWSGHHTGHSSLSSAEFKNAWSFRPLPHTLSRRERDNFTFQVHFLFCIKKLKFLGAILTGFNHILSPPWNYIPLDVDLLPIVV